MNGVGGYEGWRWIFIIEGIATLAVGFATFFLLVDLPSASTSWLSSDEVQFLELQRKFKQGGLNAKGHDVEGGATGFHWRELKMVLTNWKQWVLVLALTCQAVGVYGVKFHLPTLTKTMGFSSTNAQLLSVPPYILACAACILIPRLSDHCKNRGYFVMGSFATMVVGWIVVTALQGDFSGARIAPGYIFICFGVVGNFATSPLIIAWGNNNTAPAGRRAMVSAFLNTVCNFGGIVGSFMYLNREAPVYNTGNGITIAAGVIGCACAVVLHVAWNRANGVNGQRKEVDVRSTYSDDELLRLGDRSPFFRYME
ncbi:hypothetical protein N0V82_008545 [Gnomoniopsis sp. IMI 355080]|nr:hypothetical protein N0V82_008545 [Gnomoniopsis sp. IMI 355080]